MSLSPSDLAVAIGMEHSFLFPQLSVWLLMNWSSKITDHRGPSWRSYLKWSFPSIPNPSLILNYFSLSIFNWWHYLFLFYILWLRVVLCACSVFSICCGHEQTLEMSTLPPGALISLFLLRFLGSMYVSHSVYCCKGKIILLWLHYPSGHYNRVIDICWMSNLEREQFNYFTVE